MINIIQGDALNVIRTFEKGTFGGLITDPPYNSGGATLEDKSKPTAQKYTGTKANCPFPDFEGDSKDQRSFTSWAAEWLGEARARCKPGAPVVLFIDWRQMPALTDALQWAGWTWRGTAAWDKINARPQRGRFRQQAEYIVWGSNGKMPTTRCAPTLPGVFRYSMPTASTRSHQTEKPLELMRELVKICEPGAHILDPFMGSGTTLEAAALEGYDATGIELSEYYTDVARQRLSKYIE